MHYPWWYVPYLTAPMLIAVVSVLHMFVSHYAVGGGLFLAVETRYAYRTGNTAYLDYLHRHAGFFVLITVVYGAITGVGIWWTIGLASPLATETLIHLFVFAWGMEYVAFILEVASAFAFYYLWGRLDTRSHLAMAWIYAASAWLSLFFITGITAFMLAPGKWPAHPTFWNGFLNPQLIPQVFSRTGGALLLATLYVYLHATFTASSPELHYLIQRRSTLPGLLGAVLVTLGGVLWYVALPPSAKAALVGASALNELMAVLFAVTIAVFAMLYLGPFRHPGWLSPGFAILFLGAGFAAIASGEFIREAVRKPYILYNVVLCNQILPAEIAPLRRSGYLNGGVWTRALVSAQAPQVLQTGKTAEGKLLSLPPAIQRQLGQTLFMHHCNDCHALGDGYSGLLVLTRGWTPPLLHELVLHPEQFHFFMPPWCGTAEEAELLSRYLSSQAPPPPPNMNYGKGKP